VKRRWKWIVLLIILADGLAGGWWYYWQRERSQDAVIQAAAQRYGVDPALVKAVVWKESWFNPRARGKKEEIGLMQLRAAAAGEWAAAERIPAFETAHLLDPATNTLAGTWYLHTLMKRYSQTDNPVPYALADYNAGRSHVLKWNKGAASTNSAAFIGQIDFPGTRQYVQAILKRRDRYHSSFPPPVSSQ